VDEILIWSKDLLVIIKSLEKTYMLKSVRIYKYHLGGNVEFLGEAWKNQGLGLAISAKTSKLHSEICRSFWQRV
jgi:hypothetical protein